MIGRAGSPQSTVLENWLVNPKKKGLVPPILRLPRWFNAVSNIAVLASLVEYSIGTVSNLPPALGTAVGKAAILLRVAFGIEYVLRMLAAPKPWTYIRSALGILDLAAVVFEFGPIKLLRLAKLLGRSSAYVRLRDSIKEIRRDLAVALLGTGILIYGAAVGIYYCERDVQPEAFGSIPAALWWAVITLTTIGYGDVYPVTPLGKVLTTFVALLGLGMVAIPTGLLAAALMKSATKST